MKDSAIQWTDHTFNAWEGCTKVAPECKNCYAEILVDKRFGRAKWGKGQPRRRTSENLWKQPLRWNEIAKVCGGCGESFNYGYDTGQQCPNFCGGALHRARVFCLSLGDWLDEEVPIEWLADLLKLIHDTPNLDWQLLTKRPQNWRDRVGEAIKTCRDACEGRCRWLQDWLDGTPPHNVWIGVSAGADQKAALDIPAKIHFLSCEPMLHSLDEEQTHITQEFDWIIFGGESGKNARFCDIDWIRRGVEMCRFYDIAPFVKQLGARVIGLPPNGEMRGLLDSHGGDISEWPEDLRVREFPV